MPLLARIGYSHVYTSPVLQAAAGSTHGYDVVDPTRPNAEVGGEEARLRFVGALHAHGLRWLLDIVPNHMAIDPRENAWWWDVLENGPSSYYASYFDIDWNAPEGGAVVLAPILGEHRGRVLENREIRVEREDDRFVVRYFDHAMPLAPPTWDVVLREAARFLDGEARDTMEMLAEAHADLPKATASDRASVRRRHRDKRVLRRFLRRFLEEDRAASGAVERALAALNDDPDALDALLERQNYRLAFWRIAERELDYRRFFDINTLVGLRVEDEAVFADTHRLVLDWVERGDVDGLRVDHVDGLADPEGYLRRLREAAPNAWLLVEKILVAEEELRRTWPIAGTTGYDFLNDAGGLFVDPAGEAALAALEEQATGEARSFTEVAREAKLQVLREVLASDVERLTTLFARICGSRRDMRDYGRHELQDALVEVAASFPVYRTYVSERAGDQDEKILAQAQADAATKRPDLDPTVLSFLVRLLRGDVEGAAARELRTRFQQLTGPAMAKGVEDTAFYRAYRLLSLSEVGGEPARFGLGVEAFHRRNAAAQERWPERLLATSTHDTKRSEDVRARISVLSELPEEWSALASRLAAIAERHRPPDRASEIVLYQTLVGAWPIDGERLSQFALKAAREAKVRTSWTRGDAAYEEALAAFARALAADADVARAVEDFLTPLLPAARVASLAQTLLKMTSPGVPDVYQGCELWEESLVDPDNRRPVDWERRAAALDELDRLDGQPEAILARLEDGLPKLHVIRTAAALRTRRPEAFGPGHAGRYEPLATSGSHAARAVAFQRGDAVATVVPRLVSREIAATSAATFASGLGTTSVALSPGTWRNVLTGDETQVGRDGAVPLATLWARFPAALLERTS